jgi:hypothetical protein
LSFSYRLRARFPMQAQTPPPSAYDYYNPTDLTMQPPLEVTVSEHDNRHLSPRPAHRQGSVLNRVERCGGLFFLDRTASEAVSL